ncbi:MAG: hypothetical protein WDM77_08580 [Steroidobacteraceae bacterium]
MNWMADPQDSMRRTTSHLVHILHDIRLNPVVEGYVTVGDQSLQLLGLDPLGAAGLAPASPEGPGTALDSSAALAQWLSGSGAVVLSQETAARLRLRTRSVFNVDVGGHALTGQLLGVLAGAHPACSP